MATEANTAVFEKRNIELHFFNSYRLQILQFHFQEQEVFSTIHGQAEKVYSGSQY